MAWSHLLVGLSVKYGVGRRVGGTLGIRQTWKSSNSFYTRNILIRATYYIKCYRVDTIWKVHMEL